MNQATKYLCENIQGCKLGYTQSDEITLLLTDYDTLTTNAWFDNNVQKICSVSASMATLQFNKFFKENVQKYFNDNVDIIPLYDDEYDFKESFDKDYFYHVLCPAEEMGAMFDSRCFNIPIEEVVNCFIWRQQDATRNAIQMLGQTYFPHKELDHKSCNDIQDMLMLQKNINFNNMPTEFKRGVCCVKKIIQNPTMDIKDGACPVQRWIIDKNIPIFSQNRDYIEQLLVSQNIKERSGNKNE